MNMNFFSPKIRYRFFTYKLPKKRQDSDSLTQMLFRSISDGVESGKRGLDKQYSADDLDKSYADFGMLPAPMSFKELQKQRAFALSQSKAVTVVSPSKPYRILYISERMASLLGYEPNLLCGRSFSTLQGPKSHPAALQSLIKNASSQANVQTPFVIYSSSGAEHEVVVHCTSIFNERGKICANSLQSDAPNYEGAALWRLPAGSVEINVLFEPPQTQQQIVRRFRKLYNFRTGLTIQAAFDRRHFSSPANISE